MESEPCTRCGMHTFGTFGAEPWCLACLRLEKAGIRARLRRQEPQYAPGVLRCDQCGAIREEGGEDDWFELAVHGAHEPAKRQCNGRMRRVTVAELEQIVAQGGDAA